MTKKIEDTIIYLVWHTLLGFVAYSVPENGVTACIPLCYMLIQFHGNNIEVDRFSNRSI